MGRTGAAASSCVEPSSNGTDASAGDNASMPCASLLDEPGCGVSSLPILAALLDEIPPSESTTPEFIASGLS